MIALQINCISFRVLLSSVLGISVSLTSRQLNGLYLHCDHNDFISFSLVEVVFTFSLSKGMLCNCFVFYFSLFPETLRDDYRHVLESAFIALTCKARYLCFTLPPLCYYIFSSATQTFKIVITLSCKKHFHIYFDIHSLFLPWRRRGLGGASCLP